MGGLGLPLLEGVAPARRGVLLRTRRTTTEGEINGTLFIISLDHRPDVMTEKSLLKCYLKEIIPSHCKKTPSQNCHTLTLLVG